MGNPILQKLTQGMGNKNISGFVNLARMVRGANNPQAMFQNLVSQNPSLGKAVNLINKYGNNPKDVYYNLCKEMGVDADEFLKQFQ